MSESFFNEIKKVRTRSLQMKEKQAQALSLMQEGKSVFLTGPGGVGKTALLKAFASTYTANLAITSTTGISALLLSGTTVHSFLGIGLGKKSVKTLMAQIMSQNWLKNRWRSLDCLIIDEISMMHPDLFDKLEEIARKVRNSTLPFGGIQLVLSGDFLQLPCIGTMNFCFQAKSWDKCVPNVILLDEIIRQRDKRFQKCLNSIRIGNITSEVKHLLDSRVGAILFNEHGIKPTKLYSKNFNVEKENNAELDKLAEKDCEFFIYEMDFEVPIDLRGRKQYLENKFKRYCPMMERLELCLGAQVMLVKNIDLACGLANGSRGVVVGFSESDIPIVQFLNGECRPIYFETWEIFERERTVLRAHQIPLRVAYAISIHKSQGCSMDYAIINLSNIFEYGQAYVALSRVKSLRGLSIIGIDYDCIKADPLGIEYYKKLK